MARQMVGIRKGGPLPTVPTTATGSAVDDGPYAPDDSDVVQCPNCDCQFNETTMKVVQPGKPVVGGQELTPEAGIVPGKLGAAHDAAYGLGIEGNLLSDIKSRMR